MRNFDEVIAHTLKWEGGLSRDKNDSASVNACPTSYKGVPGWHTNKGITYAVWKSKKGKDSDAEFFNMSNEDWLIFYKIYYNAVKGDKIQSDSIAFFATQIAWGSGAGNAGKQLQKACNMLGAKLKIDGAIGPMTLGAVNTFDESELFDAMYMVRKSFFEAISKGKNARFLKGWMNRLNDFYKNFKP